MSRVLLMAAFLAILAAPLRASADADAETAAAPSQPPACERASLGATSCLAEKLCECVYDRGGSITGTPSGFRWDCGVLRASCGNDAGDALNTNPYPGPFPYAVEIDRPRRPRYR